MRNLFKFVSLCIAVKQLYKLKKNPFKLLKTIIQCAIFYKLWEISNNILCPKTKFLFFLNWYYIFTFHFSPIKIIESYTGLVGINIPFMCKIKIANINLSIFKHADFFTTSEFFPP